MSCLDKCSNLCVIFFINPFICKWLGLAPRCKQWGPECWIKVCYLLCGLLISFVSVVPDCVTTECCDCLSFSASSALTTRHFFFFFDCGKRAAFQGPRLWAQKGMTAFMLLMCWYEESNTNCACCKHVLYWARMERRMTGCYFNNWFNINMFHRVTVCSFICWKAIFSQIMFILEYSSSQPLLSDVPIQTFQIAQVLLHLHHSNMFLSVDYKMDVI